MVAPDHQFTFKSVRLAKRLYSIAAVFGAFTLSGCDAGILDPQGRVGIAEKSILIDSLGIMLAIVIPTIVATAAFSWWFRASNTKARYRPDFVYSGRIEMVVWGIPLLTIMLLGGVAWIGSHELDPYKELASDQKPLEIQVVSLDWKWLFIYPGQKIAAVNQLVIPAGVPLHLSLTSASVMSAFFVPQLGSMIYTMNGMSTQLHLEAAHPGIFYGESSHYNGDGFSDMNFQVHAVSAGDFTQWVQSAQQSGAALSAADYTGLEKQSQHVAPALYTLPDPGLFQSIVNQSIPPAPGPDTGEPSQFVSPRSGG